MPDYTLIGGAPNPDPYYSSEPDCSTCGDEGFVELSDHPELWGEDCFMEEDRSVTCPDCGGMRTGDEYSEGRDS